jgi:hypothetical protein
VIDFLQCTTPVDSNEAKLTVMTRIKKTIEWKLTHLPVSAIFLDEYGNDTKPQGVIPSYLCLWRVEKRTIR